MPKTPKHGAKEVVGGGNPDVRLENRGLQAKDAGDGFDANQPRAQLAARVEEPKGTVADDDGGAVAVKV